MKIVIQATNITLDHVERHSLEAECLRDLTRYSRDIDLATAYVSKDEDGTHRCRLAVQAMSGARLSGESKGDTHLMALASAASTVAAGLQREQLRRTDPRMNRPGRH